MKRLTLATGMRMRIVAATFALLAFGVLASALWRYAELNAAVLAARSAADTAARATAPVVAVVDTPSPPRLAALARSSNHLNVPWATILDELERHATKDIALLAIDPDAVQGRVRLEFEARRLQSLVDFAQRLGSSPGFERVALAKHEIVDRDPAKPVRMSLEVKLARSGEMAIANKP
jgi:hypothetical protein